MAEFLSNYGLWILLGGIFVAMHMFGMGCCGGGHQHGSKPKEGSEDGQAEPGAAPPTKSAVTTNPARRGGCH